MSKVDDQSQMITKLVRVTSWRWMPWSGRTLDVIRQNVGRVLNSLWLIIRRTRMWGLTSTYVNSLWQNLVRFLSLLLWCINSLINRNALIANVPNLESTVIINSNRNQWYIVIWGNPQQNILIRLHQTTLSFPILFISYHINLIISRYSNIII